LALTTETTGKSVLADPRKGDDVATLFRPPSRDRDDPPVDGQILLPVLRSIVAILYDFHISVWRKSTAETGTAPTFLC